MTRKISPQFYLSPLRDRTVVNLLLIEGAEDKSHYIWIKNMSSLVAHSTNSKSETFVCNYCLHPFSSAKLLDDHVKYCQRHPAQATRYPDPENPDERFLKFKAHKKQFYLPFYLVCDFEAFLTPVVEDETVEPPAKKRKVEGKTKVENEHVVSGFACKRVSNIPEYETPIVVYSGPDPMAKFFEHIMQENKEIGELMSKNEPMLPLTKEEKKNYSKETMCPYCKDPFTRRNHKTRHHCHITGRFISAACNNCNLQLKLRGRKRQTKTVDGVETETFDYFLPVIFHNLKNYDAHFIIRNFQSKYVEHVDDKSGKVTYDDVNGIPNNTEKFMKNS